MICVELHFTYSIMSADKLTLSMAFPHAVPDLICLVLSLVNSAL